MAITKVFQDAVPKTENRHYQQVTNSDGTISLIDVTEYEVEGTHLNAKILNEYTGELNQALSNVTIRVVEETLLASGWVDDTYTLTVSGVTDTSIQELAPAFGITKEQLENLQDANIQDGGQSTDTIILKSFGVVPTVDIPVRVILRGEV